MKNEEIKETLKIIQMIKDVMEVNSYAAAEVYKYLKQTDSDIINISEKIK